MLTNSQRCIFFKMAKAAYSSVSPGVPFEDWRAAVMSGHGLPQSTRQMDRVWDFERAMVVMAEAACDWGAASYYAGAARRRLEWIMQGLGKDLAYIRQQPTADAYVLGIIDQANLSLDGQTPEDARRAVALVDTVVRKAAKRAHIGLGHLPTAGRPWCIRGGSAARYAAFIGVEEIGVQS